jgi:hypothetical protein
MSQGSTSARQDKAGRGAGGTRPCTTNVATAPCRLRLSGIRTAEAPTDTQPGDRALSELSKFIEMHQ